LQLWIFGFASSFLRCCFVEVFVLVRLWICVVASLRSLRWCGFGFALFALRVNINRSESHDRLRLIYLTYSIYIKSFIKILNPFIRALFSLCLLYYQRPFQTFPFLYFYRKFQSEPLQFWWIHGLSLPCNFLKIQIWL